MICRYELHADIPTFMTNIAQDLLLVHMIRDLNNVSNLYFGYSY